MTTPDDSGRMTPPREGCYSCGGTVRTHKRGLGWYCHKCAEIEYRKQGIPVAERGYRDHG